MIRRRVVGLLLAAACAVLPAACSGAPGDAGPVTPAEITALLAAHGRAVHNEDRAAFLSGVGPGRFRAMQAGEFANLVQLPLTRWSYRLGPRAQAANAQAAARRRYGPSAVVYRVELTEQLAGVDARPATHDLYWTFARVDGRVAAVADTALAGVGGASWQGPWDFGRLSVLAGAHSLVLGHPRDSAELSAVRATVDAAVPVVTSVWGTGWTQDVLVVVPDSTSETAADAGGDTGETLLGGAGATALATSDGTAPVSGDPVGQQLVVAASQFARLSGAGRRIVVQHEVTHIATAAATGDASPRWVVEGFAEYVGNLGSGQPVPTAAAELAAQVRAGRVPSHLPGDVAFTSARTAAVAYEQAWLACRLIADRAGAAGLARFYRVVGSAQARPATAVADGLRAVLHETTARFTAQWRAYVSRQLG